MTHGVNAYRLELKGESLRNSKNNANAGD